MSRLRAKRSAWGSYANCWKSLGAGTTPGCGVGKAPGKTANQALLRELVRLHEKYPALGLDSLYHMLKPAFHCSRGRVHRLMKAAGIHSQRKRGLQSHHQLPPQLPHRAKPAPSASSLLPALTKPGVGDITYIPPTGAKAGLDSPLSKTCAPRKLWGTPFPSASTPQLTLGRLNMAVRTGAPCPWTDLPQRPGRPVRRRGLP